MVFPIWIRKNRTLSVSALFLFLGLASFLVFYGFYSQRDVADILLKNALTQVPLVTSYSQVSQTETQISDRRLVIVGTYDNDTKNNRFASFSTTSLYIARDKTPHSFTHQNISIGDDVYTKIETHDSLLKKVIQSSSTWKHFTRDAIPSSFTAIAISGPIEDTLALLGARGTYLSLVKKQGLVWFDKEKLFLYTFKLGPPPKDTSGALSALLGRIGKDGHVDVWIDPKDAHIRYIRLTNYPYISTTTVSHLNDPLIIVPPTGM